MTTRLNQTHSNLVSNDNLQPSTPKMGKPRQRMQWPDQLNTDPMLFYYKVTKEETILTGNISTIKSGFY